LTSPAAIPGSSSDGGSGAMRPFPPGSQPGTLAQRANYQL